MMNQRRYHYRRFSPETIGVQRPIPFKDWKPLFPDYLSFVCQRLSQNGIKVYLVGGSIREMLLGRHALDWDLVADCDMDKLRQIFSDVSHFSFKDMVFSMILSKEKLEISPVKGQDIYEDLSKRDFTINAMAYDFISGQLLDPFNGLQDLKEGILRAVKDPAQRFLEDPLRMLRAIRFMAELFLTIGKPTLKEITIKAHLLERVSTERIRDELKKILLSPSPYMPLWYLISTKLMPKVILEVSRLSGIKQSPPHKYKVLKHTFFTVENTPPSLSLRFAALLHDIAKPLVHSVKDGRHRFLGHQNLGAQMTRDILTHLRFPNSLIEHVSLLVKHHLIFYDPSWTDKAVRRFVHKIEPLSIWELLALRRADILAQGTNIGGLDHLRSFADRIKTLGEIKSPSQIPLCINGNTIMAALRIPQGPKLGRILKEIREWVSEHQEDNEPKKLLLLAKEIGSRLK